MVKLLVLAGAAMLVGMIAVLDGGGASGDEHRAIEIDVHVRDYKDMPVESVVLGVVVDGTTQVDGATNENGNVTFELEVATDVARVEITSSFAAGNTSFTPQQQLEVVRDMRSRVKDYAAWDRCHIELQPDKVSYEAEIVFPEAIVISGVVVGENDEPIGNIVYARNAGLADARGRREFQLSNVRKAAECSLLVTRYRVDGDSTIVPLHLTQEQTQADVDLGRIVIPDTDKDALLEVHLDNIGILRRSHGVTFVSADGDILFAAPAYRSGHEQAGELSGNPIGLPAGKYYLGPGTAANLPRDEIWALVEALRQGRDLDALGIHTITLEPGEKRDLEIDLEQIRKPIRDMMTLEDG